MNDKIVDKSLELFLRYGLKNVNMSSIASELSISKRTLYEHFASKEDLVYQAMELLQSRMSEELATVQRESLTHLETIIRTNEVLCNYISSFCPAFCRDVVLFKEANMHVSAMEERLKVLYADLFAAGVREGVFVSDMNYDSLITLYTSFFRNNHNDFKESLMYTLLRGVCSPKGMSELTALKVVDKPGSHYWI